MIRRKTLPSAARRKYEKGATTPAIGLEYGMCPQTVASQLRAMGTQMRPRGATKNAYFKLKAADIPEILRRCRTTESLESIGKAFGVSRERIRQLSDEAGIPKRRAMLSEGKRTRDIAHKQAVAARRKETQERTRLLSQLWKGGITCRGLMPYIGAKTEVRAASEISRLRKMHPKMFPLRVKRKTANMNKH